MILQATSRGNLPSSLAGKILSLQVPVGCFGIAESNVKDHEVNPDNLMAKATIRPM